MFIKYIRACFEDVEKRLIAAYDIENVSSEKEIGDVKGFIGYGQLIADKTAV